MLKILAIFRKASSLIRFDYFFESMPFWRYLYSFQNIVQKNEVSKYFLKVASALQSEAMV